MPDRLIHGAGVRDFAVPIVTAVPLAWRGGGAELISRQTVGSGRAEVQLSRHVLYFTFDQCRDTFNKVRVDGGDMFCGSPQNVDLTIIGAGARYDLEYRHDTRGVSRYLAIFLDAQMALRASGAEHLQSAVVRPSVGPSDPLMWEIAFALRRECEAGAPHGTLYAETAAAVLSLHLLRHHSNMDALRLKPTRGGLAPWQARTVCDYMQDRLNDDIGLSDLAGICDYSTAHFARAFKQTTGQSPHKWLTARRIERAKDLLINTSMPMVEIASACGFADRNHFSSCFKQWVGATPAGYRRDRCW